MPLISRMGDSGMDARLTCGRRPARRSRTAILVNLAGGLLGIGLFSSVNAKEDGLLDLSLEELMNVDVTSVSKKAEPLAQAAAAVFVITGEDLRRSGVTSIPEALRMAPGVQVGRIDANKWAISVRGFNGRFSNKLLVLLDGRTLYTPLFSGVFWDVQDTLLEDVERIEVVRGPGATLWGANAVNGVINIITKRAADTQGAFVTAGAGSEEKGFVGLRSGGAISDDAHYRVYGKFFRRDGGKQLVSGEDGKDDWQQVRGGFRVDFDTSATDAFTVQGDAYTGDSGETVTASRLNPPFRFDTKDEQDVAGVNLLGRWTRTFDDDSALSLQAFYDRTDRSATLIDEVRDTLDLEFQHRFSPFAQHELVWGLGYRFSHDDFGSNFTVSLQPDSESLNLFNAFVQDEITLIEDRLRVTVGSKFEHNDFTGFEVQPSVRALWTPSERQALWGSISRAVRTPSRSESDGRLRGILGIVPPNPAAPIPVPTVIGVLGNDNLESEEVISYELGFRMQPADAFSFDIAAFYNNFDNFRGSVQRAPTFEFTHIFVPVQVVNATDAETYGVEVSAELRPMSWWRLQGYYSYLNMELHSPNSPNDELPEGQSPQQQASLRSSMNLRHDLDLDIWLRYTDSVPALSIDGYVTADVRIAWRPTPDLEISLVGQNLLDDRRQEYQSELQDIPRVELERGVYGQLRWQF